MKSSINLFSNFLLFSFWWTSCLFTQKMKIPIWLQTPTGQQLHLCSSSFIYFIFFALSLSLIIFPSFNYFAEICKNALNDLRKTAHKYFISTSLTNIVIVIEKVIIFFKPRGVFMEHISGFSQAQIFGVDCAWWYTWFLGNENVMRLLTYLSYYSFVLFLY